MSDYMVSRKRKRHAVDPCLGFYLLSTGKVVSSPSSKSSNNSPNLGFKALAACTEFHEDTLVPSSIENKLGAEDICDASHSQHLEFLPDYGLQHTPKCARQIQPVKLGSENLNSSGNMASDSGQLMMTVEDFLKRSTKREAVGKKQYGKPKRRIKRLDDNGALFEAEQHEILGSDAGDTSQDILQLRSKKIRRATIYESSSDDDASLNQGESSPLEKKRKKTRRRTRKPLKERLYEAAVLTHGHPDDILVHGVATGSELAPSRRPLHFIPNAQPELDDQTDKRRPRTWSLVDPRKSTAIRTASFSSKIRPCLQNMNSNWRKTANLSVQPPKQWKFTGASHSSLGDLKSTKQPKIPTVRNAYECPPLAFVSLTEAEEDYKSIFSSGNHKRNGRLPSVYTSTSTLPMVSVAGSMPCAEACMSNPKMQMVPLEEVIQSPNFAIETSAPVAVDQIKTVDKLNVMPSSSLISSPIINSVSSPTAQALPVTPKSTQDKPITKITPARNGSSRANIRERASIRRDSDVTSKPMRPLASFLSEFLQNIRNVAVSQDQPYVPDKHLVSTRPLCKASRNGLERNPRQYHVVGMQPRPGAANLTDITGGISVSQQSWTNDLESIHQTDPNYRDHMNRRGTPEFLYNHRLSPDILAALEPQNYQVILSSPS